MTMKRIAIAALGFVFALVFLVGCATNDGPAPNLHDASDLHVASAADGARSR